MMKLYSITVPAIIENISKVVHVVTVAAEYAGFDGEDIFRCQLVTDEACANIIDHAYRGLKGAGEIELKCFAQPGQVEINLYDVGAPFNPTESMPYDFPPDLRTLEPGGVGLQLIYHYMDSVQFSSQNRRNHLKMIKTPSRQLTKLNIYPIPVFLAESETIVIAPRGKLDSEATRRLDRIVTQVVEDGYNHIVLDLRDTTYIVSRAISTIIAHWKSLQANDGVLLLCNLSPRIETVINLVGLRSVLNIHSSRQSALDTLAKLP